MSNTKSILLLVAGVLVLGLVVCGGGAAYWYFQHYRVASVPDVGPLPGRALVLPADSAVVAGFDVKGFVGSAGYKQIASGELKGLGPTLSPEEAERMKKEVREGLEKGLKEAEDKVGIRLDRDLDRIVIAASNVSAPTPEVAVVALGRFDPAKVARAIEASTKAEGASVTSKTVQGIAMQVIAEPGKPGGALAFPDDTTLVAGTPAAVEAMLTSQAQRARPLEGNAPMLDLVRGLDAASGYWLVVGPSLVERAQKEAGASPIPVPMPKNLTLAGKFDGGMQLTGEMADDAAAQSVVQMVEQGLSMARAQADSPEVQKLPGAKALIEGIKVSAQARKVTISVPASGDGSALAGLVAAAALPSLMKAREAAREAQGQAEPPAAGTAAPPEVQAEPPAGHATQPPAARAPAPAPVRTPRPARVPQQAPPPAAPPAVRPAATPAPPPTPVQPVRVGGAIKPPRKIKDASPSYPPMARQARVQGVVILECTIDAQGRVADVRVLRGVPMLDQAAIDAVRQWQYEPTLQNGVPVPVIMTVTVNFKLS